MEILHSNYSYTLTWMEAVILKLAEDLNLPPEVVSKTYKAYWLFIRETIQSLPLKEELEEEEFSRLRTNFNLPKLGKLTCTYRRYQGVKKRQQHIKRRSNGNT